MTVSCYLAQHGVYERGDMPPCEGRLVKAHLVSQQVLRREVPEFWRWDPRVWVPVCGGLHGNAGHHGMFDVARTIRLPADALPAGVVEFAEAFGLVWYLERTYGFERRSQ